MWSVVIGLTLALVAWMGFNYVRVRRAAKLLNNEEFSAMMKSSQVVDVREPSEFERKHILGARNIPSTQFKESLRALRKEKPVLIYENSRGTRVNNVALLLKKHGFNQVYILSYGLDEWKGKVKTK